MNSLTKRKVDKVRGLATEQNVEVHTEVLIVGKDLGLLVGKDLGLLVGKDLGLLVGKDLSIEVLCVI
jgi:hypothetical protein